MINWVYDRRHRLPRAPAGFKRAKFDEADGGDKFRLVERGFQAADGIGLAEGHRHLQNLLGHRRDLRHARAATAQKNTAAQVIEQSRLLQILRNQLEDFLQPQRHDAAQVFNVDGFERQAKFVGNGNRLAPAFRIHLRRAVFQLEFFRAAQRHLQAISQIVGNVVAADRQHAGVFDDPVGVHHVIRRAATDIDDQRAQFLLLVGQQGKG